MDTNQVEGQSSDRTEPNPVAADASPQKTDVKAKKPAEIATKSSTSKKPKAKAQKLTKKEAQKSKSKKKQPVSSEDDSDDDSDDSTPATSEDVSSESEPSESETETEKEKKKRKAKEKKARLKAKEKKAQRGRKKAKKHADSDEESDDDSDENSSESDAEGMEQAELEQMMRKQRQQQQLIAMHGRHPPIDHFSRSNTGLIDYGTPPARIRGRRNDKQLHVFDALGNPIRMDRKVKKKRASKLEYKRVDQLWDSSIHNYKLTETAEDEESSEYDQYLFNVRRTFDWEGKYKTTLVDIKSKLLREALKDVMDGVKGVSLVEETPVVDPNLLFLYLEELRASLKSLKSKLRNGEKMKRKDRKRNENRIKHLKVLLKYLDKDYAETKKTLYPLLDSGLITFDLLWALFKPNTLAYTTTYGSPDEPRAFRIEMAEKEFNFMRGEWYCIEGKYLEYDGKIWGMGSMVADVPAFKGARKIASLNCYPLQYHKDEAKLRAQLIERGKKFVSLQGVNYRSHQGLAYYKKKRQVIKVNVNGRVMVDAAIFRRLLANYQISTVKANDDDEFDDSSESGNSDDECDFESSIEERGQCLEPTEDNSTTKTEIILDENKRPRLVEVSVDDQEQEMKSEKLDEVAGKVSGTKALDEKKILPTFTDEEYLIASPVVLGFAFAEKLWLEFTVSGIKDIEWNTGAYDSLVLEGNTKDIVKALVESHKYHPAESIDDVIQGKGKGLVAVLHGPPGTGKTLTAEGISELLKCPLYMVSAGELGTDPRTLESELQKILDIAHAWGAVLLLDEADVFLEKRTIHDIHRNALVSIFLRLLEYFQGILFLTTNRVETFDDAFQSRIHIALRYGELTMKAKKSVFKMFIERVRVLEGIATMPFSEDDFNSLSKHDLNGRQIKNTVRTAQALAVNKGEPLSMEHIKRVLDVHISFDRDLKGGTGYVEAMRNYM